MRTSPSPPRGLLGEIARKPEVSEQMYYRWRNRYGGMKGEEMKRLNEFEEESERLKRVGDQALDVQMLKELPEGSF